MKARKIPKICKEGKYERGKIKEKEQNNQLCYGNCDGSDACDGCSGDGTGS